MCFKLKIIITYITFLSSYKMFPELLKRESEIYTNKVEAQKVQDED